MHGSTDVPFNLVRLHDRAGVDHARGPRRSRRRDPVAIAPVARASVPAPRAVPAAVPAADPDHGRARRRAGRGRARTARPGRARPRCRGHRDAGHRPPPPDRGPPAAVRQVARGLTPSCSRVGRTSRRPSRRPSFGAPRPATPTAYGELVTMHEGAAFRVAYLLLGSASDAEDAAQEGFVRAYLALARFRAGEPFRPWLLQVVGNEARNRRRALGRRAGMLDRAVRAVRGDVVTRRRAVPGARPARRGGPRRGPRGPRPAPRRGAAGRRLSLPDGALGGGDRRRAGDPAGDREVAAAPGARPAPRGPVRHGPARRGRPGERGQGGRRGAAAATGRGERRLAGDAGPAGRGAGAASRRWMPRRAGTVATAPCRSPARPGCDRSPRWRSRCSRCSRRRRRRRPRVPPAGVRHRVRRAPAVRAVVPGSIAPSGSGSAGVPPTAGAQRDLGSPIPVSDARPSTSRASSPRRPCRAPDGAYVIGAGDRRIVTLAWRADAGQARLPSSDLALTLMAVPGTA